MAETRKKIPVCPLLSAGSSDNRICIQENCAWYMASTKTCSMYVIGHKTVLEVKDRQQGKNQ